MTVQEFTLSRSGLNAIRFRGELIAEASDPLPPWEKAKKDVRRWHILKLYKTESGKYIIEIGFRTRLEQETDQDTIEVCDNQQEVEDFLVGNDGYDPCQFLEGFPNIPKFEKHQERLEDRVTKDFEARVGKLLAIAGFAEMIE